MSLKQNNVTSSKGFILFSLAYFVVVWLGKTYTIIPNTEISYLWFAPPLALLGLYTIGKKVVPVIFFVSLFYYSTIFSHINNHSYFSLILYAIVPTALEIIQAYIALYFLKTKELRNPLEGSRSFVQFCFFILLLPSLLTSWASVLFIQNIHGNALSSFIFLMQNIGVKIIADANAMLFMFMIVESIIKLRRAGSLPRTLLKMSIVLTLILIIGFVLFHSSITFIVFMFPLLLAVLMIFELYTYTFSQLFIYFIGVYSIYSSHGVFNSSQIQSPFLFLMILVLCANLTLLFVYTYVAKTSEDKQHLQRMLNENKEMLIESNEQFQTIFNNAPIGIMILTFEGRILTVNNAAKKIYSFSSNLVGLKFSDLHISKSDCDEMFEALNADGQSVKKTIAANAGDSARFLSVTINNSEIDGEAKIVAFISDITHEVELDKKREENEDYIDLFMSQIPIHLFMKDSNDRTLLLSHQFEKMLGRPIDELIGKSSHELFPTDLADKIKSDDQNILKNNIFFETEEELNGYYYLTKKLPIQRKNGEKLLMGFTLDITELKKVQIELEYLRTGLENQVTERTHLLNEKVLELNETKIALTESEAILKALINNLPFEFWGLDEKLNYSMQNTKSVEKYGNLISNNITDQSAPSHLRDNKELLQNSVMSGKVYSDVYVQKSDENTKYFETIISPVLHNEIPIGIVGVDFDVTKRVEAEKAILNLNNELENKVRQRTSELSQINENLSDEITLRRKIENALKISEDQLKLKLESITSPETELSIDELINVIDIGALERLFNTYYELTKYPISIIDIYGKPRINIGWIKACECFHRNNPISLKNCIDSDVELTKDINKSEIKFYKCKNNIWEAVTPIFLCGKHVLNLFFGQFFFDDDEIDYTTFEKQAELFGFEKDKYLESIKQVPIFRKDEVEKAMKYYSLLADMIYELSISNVKIAKANSELIEKERQINESRSMYVDIFDESPISIWEEDFSGCKNYFDNLKRKGVVDFKMHFDENLDAVSYCSRALKIVDFNKATVKIFEAFSKDHLMQNIRKTFTRDSINKFKEVLVSLASGKNSYDGESRLKSLTGKNIDLGIRLVVSPGYEDTLERVLVIMNDISEQKKYLNAIDRERQELMSIFDGIEQIVYVTDPYSYEVVFVNKASANLLGTNPVGKLCYKEFYGKDAPCEFCTNEIILQNKPDVHRWNFYNERIRRHFDVFDKIITWPDGRDLRFEIAIDITSLLEAKKALKTKSDELEVFFSSTLDLLCIASTDGYFIRLNKEWEKVLGYSVSELEGRLFLDFVHPDDLQSTIDTMAALADQKEVLNFVNRYRGKDGIYHWIEWRIFPSGQTVYAAARDISERMIYSESLRESEEKFRRIFEDSPLGMAMLSIDYTFVEVNPAFSKMLGYYASELKMITFPGITHPDHIQENVEGIKKLIERKIQQYKTEQRYLTRSGHIMWGQVTISILRNSDSTFRAYLAMIIDITDRKRTEAELIHAKNSAEEKSKSLKELNATKDKFFSIVAHDLRNPFFYLLASSQFFKDEYYNLTDKEKIEIVTKFHDGTAKIHKLLENLLQWSRMKLDRIDFSKEELDLYSLFDEELADLEIIASNKKITIFNNIKHNVIIFADKQMIKSVIRNLFSNAIKFSNPNSEIYVSSNESEKEVNFFVIDTGVGISEENISKLFQIDGAYSSKGTNEEEGTGLGLILCKEFIDKHNGSIKVTSKAGKGSTFIVTLPKK